MKFHKYVAAGNDFIVFNGLEENIKNYNDLALNVCNRHFGIGADGILVCKESSIADIKMLYYNSDGSQGEMCGNGIRAFSKYIYDNNIVREKEISIETLVGIKYINIDINEEGKANKIKVDMGYPIFQSKDIPINIDKEEAIEETINIEGKDYIYSAINMGVPHVVMFLKNINNIDINDLGRKIENHSNFPKKTNVNFVEIIDKGNINIYTWERGAGRTLGCGTGSCSSVVIGNKLKKLNEKVNVRAEGGNLYIELDNDYRVHMSGEATCIAKGDFLLIY